MHIAIVTMVNNEDYFLPLWINHYSKVKNAQLVVVDHGSNDGSTDKLPPNINKITIPQSKPYFELDRALTISDLQHSLLHYYDCVIYTDVDELLVVDPELGLDLAAFIEQSEDHPVISPIGLNVLHLSEAEPALDIAKPILAQRPHAYFHSNYCKPVITRTPTRWMRGFHGCDEETFLDRGLYLFHLAHFDLSYSRKRMRKRNQGLLDAESKPGFSRKHDRRLCNWGASDNEVLAEFAQLGQMPPPTENNFVFEGILQKALDSSFDNYFGDITRIGVCKGYFLHQIPDRFLNQIEGLGE